MYRACISVLADLKVPCTWADAEADQECVKLASKLGTWVLAKDSDFVILNADGYKGYATMDDLVWEYREDRTPVEESTEDSGWTQATSTRIKGRNRQLTHHATNLSHTLLPPSSGMILSLTMTVFHPDTFAAHLKIPTTFLPLFASVAGNDFTPDSYRARFSDRRKSLSENIVRFGDVLRRVITAGKDQRSPVGKQIAKVMLARNETTKPSVATLIQATIQELLIRPGTNAEINEMVEGVIDSILQYGIDTEPSGSFPSGPVGEPYSAAYREGRFSPRVLELVVNGIHWPNLFLENPDVGTCEKIIGGDILFWIVAVLNDGIPLGESQNDEVTSVGSFRVESEEEDEDEIISVVEEQTDDEDESPAYVAPEPDEPLDYTPSHSGGVPVALLTNALQRLRHQQRLRADGSRTPTSSAQRTPMTMSGVTSPRGGVAVTPAITVYHRQGLRHSSYRLPIQSLSTLIDSTSRGRASSHPLLRANGPIQLQSEQTRLKVYLHALGCNTPAIHSLAKDEKLGVYLPFIVALRWTVSRDGVKWRKSDGEAFIVSCLRLGEQGEPDEATARGIQLTAEILVALEYVAHLGEVLLLHNMGSPERMFSGRRFHSLLGNNVQLREDERGLMESLWRAVEEDGRGEWWAPEVPVVPEKKEKIKRERHGHRHSPAGSISRAKGVGGLFSALAGLSVE